MSTTTQAETDESNDAVEQLKALSRRSYGNWVSCTCIEIDELNHHGQSGIVFRFEMHATDRTTQKSFEVPDSLPNSEIKAFLDDLGYAIENVDLIEGDELWYNTVTEAVHTEPPSTNGRLVYRCRQYSPNLLNTLEGNSFWAVVWKYLFWTTVGIGIFVSGPIGSIGLFGYLNQRWKGTTMYPDNVAAWAIGLVVWNILWCGIVINYLFY